VGMEEVLMRDKAMVEGVGAQAWVGVEVGQFV